MDWILGLLHIFLWTDTSFLTLKACGFNYLSSLILIVVASSMGLLIINVANKAGLKLFFRYAPTSIQSKINFASHYLLRKCGYGGLVALILIPFVPFFKEAGLLYGQLLGLRYTLPISLLFNALRITLIIKTMF